MILGVDHVVLGCADPDATAADLEIRLGLAATGGGRHEALGTRNRLVWLGDAYLELVGVFDPNLARESWLGRPVLAALERGGGLATWAVAVDDLAETLRWTPPDVDLVGPLDGERRRADERVVRWRLAHPADLSPTAPFLIEHDRTAAEWTDAERVARADQLHPVGGRARLAGVEVVAASPAVAARRLRTLVAAAVEPMGRAGLRAQFGAQEIRLVASHPGAPAVVDVVVDVPIRTRRARVGDCDIRLRGTPAPAGAPPQPETDGDV
ncbi:MAG TPA: VOC family protein [Candidatus Limnocylindrales bacterium]|nr:VOC family protein [Candidatus Limnocylindrales bacterium]